MRYYPVVLLLLAVSCGVVAFGQPQAPHLSKQDGVAQMVVNGKPFLTFGGELGNSSASSEAYMRPLWPKFTTMHLNTILSPAYWELMEPEEGKFDFSLVDMVIKNARANKLLPIYDRTIVGMGCLKYGKWLFCSLQYDINL